MKLKVFIGPKGSGKDTCAKILQDAGITAGKIPFAGPLKQICSDVFGIPLEVFEDAVKKEEPGRFRLDEVSLHDIALSMREYLPITDWQVAETLDLFLRHTNLILTSPRQVLQYVGTEVIRSYNQNWHCKAAFSASALALLPDHEAVLSGEFFASVTDCRFLNEYAYLKANHDCEFYYVERPEAEERLALATHQSELEVRELRKLIPEEKVIYNDHTLSTLMLRTFSAVED